VNIQPQSLFYVNNIQPQCCEHIRRTNGIAECHASCPSKSEQRNDKGNLQVGQKTLKKVNVIV
jgi:hypothetical protein